MNRTLPTVRLRVPTHEDAFAWHRVFDDPEVMEFHGGRPAELSVYEELTARQRRHDAELGFCLWTMLDASGEVIGFTGAQPWERSWGPTGELEIGWRLGRAHWGKGYATAAALETLERLRAAGVPSVVAMVDARNERSIAVTRRLGMRLAERFMTPPAEPTEVRPGATGRTGTGRTGTEGARPGTVGPTATQPMGAGRMGAGPMGTAGPTGVAVAREATRAGQRQGHCYRLDL